MQLGKTCNVSTEGSGVVYAMLYNGMTMHSCLVRNRATSKGGVISVHRRFETRQYQTAAAMSPEGQMSDDASFAKSKETWLKADAILPTWRRMGRGDWTATFPKRFRSIEDRQISCIEIAISRTLRAHLRMQGWRTVMVSAQRKPAKLKARPARIHFRAGL